MSLLLGWGAYARDKNTSARLCAKNAGGVMREGGRICRLLQYLNYLSGERSMVNAADTFTVDQDHICT